MREKGSVLQFFSELHVYTQMQIDKLKKQTYFYKSLATVKASLGGEKKKKGNLKLTLTHPSMHEFVQNR